VLFLAALSLTATSGLLQLIGGMMGLGLAALFGLLLIKGSVRIDLRRFFGVTGLVLLILVARLLAGSIHEFIEAGILPSTPMELTVIGFFVQDSTSTAILIALFLLPILAMLPHRQRQTG
jgi:FTR1 family protein